MAHTGDAFAKIFIKKYNTSRTNKISVRIMNTFFFFFVEMTPNLLSYGLSFDSFGSNPVLPSSLRSFILYVLAVLCT